MVIHVHTQYQENYGTETAPYWKFKGGSTYVLLGFEHPLSDGLAAAGQAAVESVRSQIEYANPMSEEAIIDWEFKADAALTQYETDQLEFEGRVSSPSPRITLVQRAA